MEIVNIFFTLLIDHYHRFHYKDVIGYVWFTKKWRIWQNNFSCPVFNL